MSVAGIEDWIGTRWKGFLTQQMESSEKEWLGKQTAKDFRSVKLPALPTAQRGESQHGLLTGCIPTVSIRRHSVMSCMSFRSLDHAMGSLIHEGSRLNLRQLRMELQSFLLSGSSTRQFPVT